MGSSTEESDNSISNEDLALRSSPDASESGLYFPESGNFYMQNLINRPRRPTSFCVPQAVLNVMNKIPCFEQFCYTPLPTDQKLLTLMHFNLIRALCQCVILLGFSPDEMYLDVPSPFVDQPDETLGSTLATQVQRKTVFALPPTMQPTYLQKTIAHHPEIDIFPFPVYRDNIILAGKEIDDVTLCMDVTYGVGVDNIWSDKKEGVDNSINGGGRTGLIVVSHLSFPLLGLSTIPLGNFYGLAPETEFNLPW